MTTETANSAPAGAENTDSPVGGMPEILSIDDAAQRWMDNEEAETQQEATASQPPAENTAETGQTADEAAAADQTGENAAGEAQSTPEEIDFIDWDRISPDKKMRLRDGFEFDKRWVNENVDKLRKLPEIEREFATKAHQFQQFQAQLAHREQYLAQALPLAIANAQAAVPPEPEPPVFDPADPMGFLEKQAAYQAELVQRNKKIGELRQLQMAQAQKAQEVQQQHQLQTKEFVAAQQKALFDALPRLRDEGERRKFHADYVQLAESIGFEPQEYNQAVDHRVMLMADLALDGLKYRKLKSDPPKPKPVTQQQAATPPVAEPGKRQTAAEAATAKRQELLDRARRTGGSVQDIARLVAELE